MRCTGGFIYDPVRARPLQRGNINMVSQLRYRAQRKCVLTGSSSIMLVYCGMGKVSIPMRLMVAVGIIFWIVVRVHLSRACNLWLASGLRNL